jgi:hypothetical protein
LEYQAAAYQRQIPRHRHEMRNPTSIVVVEDSPTDVFLIHQALAAHGLRADLTVFEGGDKAIGLTARIEVEESVPRPRLMLRI